MANKNRTTLYVFLCLLLAVSCTPMRYVGIETYNPASVTFPGNTKKILIVNHAAVQPEVPFESTVRKMADGVRIAADSATMDFCRELGRKIAESPYFEDVRLYDGCFRTDQAFFSDPELTRGEVSRFCEDHDVDAVVSLDRLSFHIRENMQQVYGTNIAEGMDVEVSGVLRAYLPGRERPLGAVYLSDTVSPRLHPEEAFGIDLYALPDPREVLREVAAYVAAESHVNFVPYWSADTRWYYASSNARWKEATAYASAEKWEQAAVLWESLYEASVSWKAKGRLASNLALYAELAGRLTQALHWATLAHQHFSVHLKPENPDVKMQQLYIDVLEHRIAAEKTLRTQMREVQE
ncbi:MAG: DUF6340 family protein [Tannerella sp.]|jgi:hypothetical protein|nr:DUF6340 family protein [Tannerella sp.]